VKRFIRDLFKNLSGTHLKNLIGGVVLAKARIHALKFGSVDPPLQEGDARVGFLRWIAVDPGYFSQSLEIPG